MLCKKGFGFTMYKQCIAQGGELSPYLIPMDFEDNNPLCAEQASMPDATPPAEPSSRIEIVDAGKHREGTQRGHITYSIRIPDGTTIRRRYSEFESLRRMLRRLFPTLIVPPIPEKHSITAYAASPTHAHEDARVIDHRRRMLGHFLNRCRSYPQINSCFVFERFLDPNSAWAEVLASEQLARVPKSPLQAPPLNPSEAEIAHAFLPIPPTGARVKSHADTEFTEAEQHAREFEHGIGSGLDKAVRRMIARYTSLASDSADLGGQFNAFSLESANSVAPAVEKVGQAVDTGYLSTDALVEELNIKMSEPLAESAQLAATARAVLKYRRYRAVQVEMATEALNSRRKTLEQLERAEVEAKRINDYLHTDERIAKAMQEDPAEIESISEIESVDAESSAQTEAPQAVISPPVTGTVTHSKRLRLPGLSTINHAISGMIDADPENARRNNISRTQLQIKNLEAALEIAKRDSEVADEAVRQELARYNRVKDQDLVQICRAFVRCHIEWAEKNLAAWQEAKQAINS